jgi:hypothetical protein
MTPEELAIWDRGTELEEQFGCELISGALRGYRAPRNAKGVTTETPISVHSLVLESLKNWTSPWEVISAEVDEGFHFAKHVPFARCQRSTWRPPSDQAVVLVFDIPERSQTWNVRGERTWRDASNFLTTTPTSLSGMNPYVRSTSCPSSPMTSLEPERLKPFSWESETEELLCGAVA